MEDVKKLITPYQIKLLQTEYRKFVSDEVLIKYQVPKIDNTIRFDDIDQETFYKIFKELVVHNTINTIQVHIDALSDITREDK